LIELDAGNAAGYLARRGLLAVRVSALGGGVSNTVLLAECEDRRLVLKQALAKLRVEQEWLSERSRVFREAAALRLAAEVLPPGSVPEVLFEDRDNFLFAMSAAPAGAVTWKQLLLEGTICEETAERAGRMLARLISATGTPDATREFGDQTVFDQLRLDPYYRSTARRHPELAPCFTRLIEDSGNRRVSLVHGDWSPKNFLLDGASMLAIDFEVIHFGDPSFDAAFLLNHLLLKSFYRPQWRAGYAGLARRFWTVLSAGLPPGFEWMEAATLRHLGGLLLARIDGKSPAEYIREEGLKQRIREAARELILAPPHSIGDVFA